MRFVAFHGKHIIFSFGRRAFLLFLVLSLLYDFCHVISFVCFFLLKVIFFLNVLQKRKARGN